MRTERETASAHLHERTRGKRVGGLEVRSHRFARMINASTTADIVVPFARASRRFLASGERVTSTPFRFLLSRGVEYHSESVGLLVMSFTSIRSIALPGHRSGKNRPREERSFGQ